MTKKNDTLTSTYGLVVCGGNSSRMGRDKSLLQYYDKPQRYHVYNMLLPFCEKVFISCNAEQVNTIEVGYNFIEDNIAYSNIGPMAALLSAFTKFPEKNILLIGCDYPFLQATELQQFVTHCKNVPTGFYNETADIYEPLLTWYPAASFNNLQNMQEAEQYSLQHFLKDNNAVKYFPADANSMTSIDTEADFIKTVKILKA